MEYSPGQIAEFNRAGSSWVQCKIIGREMFPSGRIYNYWDIVLNNGYHCSCSDLFLRPLSALHALAEAAE